MSIGNLLSIKKKLLLDQLHTLRYYYPKNLRYALIDLSLLLSSLLFNPYRICRKHHLGPYGETPLSTLHRIAQFCNLTPTDCWLDLGSGRGRGVFWISLFFRCKAIGIERIPLFTRLARLLSPLAPATHFHCSDLHTASLQQATHIYLYSTCMSEEELTSLIPKIPSGAKVITISSPLSSCPSVGSFPVSFPWGETEAFLHLIP